AAAKVARAPWLMFLRPGVVPDAAWIAAVTRFIDAAERTGQPDTRAAAFRAMPSADVLRPPLAEAFAAVRAALRWRPRPDQGLVIGRRRYEALGGHRAEARDP